MERKPCIFYKPEDKKHAEFCNLFSNCVFECNGCNRYTPPEIKESMKGKGKQIWMHSPDHYFLSRKGVTIYVDEIIERDTYYLLKNKGVIIGAMSKDEISIREEK
jgi:hypothetical protein